MAASIFLGFISGIWISSVFHITLGSFLAVILLTLIVFLYKFFIEEENRKVLVLSSVFLLGIILGVGRMEVSNLYQDSQLQQFIGTEVMGEGIIVSEPDVREHNTKLTIKIQELTVATSTHKISEKVLVTVPLYPEFSYGDKVKIKAILEEPGEIENEDGRVFDYRGYLRVRGIWYTSNKAKIEFISSGHGSVIKTSLYKIKQQFTNSLKSALPEPESSLLSGLLLGTKQSLGKELLSDFQKTGTSHVVVLSGYNIAIVAESIISALSFLSKTASFSFGVLGIILFTLLSGAGASGTRAAIMVLVALFAKKMNRDYKASKILGFTIVLMLAPNPLLLAFDPSFQLSVLATIGLLFVSPLVSPYLTKVTERFGLREIISTTIATQITVLPYLIYNMGLLSLVSLPVNILILSTIPLTMFFGLLVGITGFISLYLSFIPAFFTYILLWYQLHIVSIGASVPFGHLSLPTFSSIILFFIYFIIFLYLYIVRKKTG